MHGSINNIKIGIYGATGRIGKALLQEIDKSSEYILSGSISSSSSEADIISMCQKSDVVIDFSIPKASIHLIKYAIQYPVKLVIGTTGYSTEEFDEIKSAAKIIPIFYDTNMSIGIYLMKKMLSLCSTNLPQDTSTHIIETHHQHKKDSPSGTALMLKEVLSKYYEPTISSIRGGEIPGIHEVQYIFGKEVLSISHTSYSKNIYAVGSIKAARFIYQNGDKPQLYNMNNLIKD